MIYEFFSGIGGWRLAYDHAASDGRFRAYEVDEACCKVYSDLYRVSFLSARKEEPWTREQEPEEDELWRCSIDKLPLAAFEGADIWLMSPPCQPFTRTGRRRDVEDPRCRALLRLAEALPRLQRPPKGILLENVVEFEVSQAYARLRESLELCGFQIQQIQLDPRDFGFPNTRRRFYLLATRDAKRVEHAKFPLKPVGDFLEDTSEQDGLQVPGPLLQKAFDDGWQLDVATVSSRATKTFTGSYGKAAYGGEGLSKAGPLLYDDPTAPMAPRTRFAYLQPGRWKHVRYFSPKEVANLMGFPANWSLPGDLPLRTQWRLIGNSVNVVVATSMVKCLLA